METFRERINIGEFESCADSVPCLSHVDGDAVGVKLEPEVDAVAALHGAGRARQAVAPEAGVGAAPPAALHRRRHDIVRTVLRRIIRAWWGCVPTSHEPGSFSSAHLCTRSNRSCPSEGSPDSPPPGKRSRPGKPREGRISRNSASFCAMKMKQLCASDVCS